MLPTFRKSGERWGTLCDHTAGRVKSADVPLLSLFRGVLQGLRPDRRQWEQFPAEYDRMNLPYTRRRKQ